MEGGSNEKRRGKRGTIWTEGEREEGRERRVDGERDIGRGEGK